MGIPGNDDMIRFLNVDEWNARPKIFHVGYFFEENCGDDMFRVVFQTLRHRLYPHHLALFRNHYRTFPEYNPSKDLIVVGGGDIVNQYFLNDSFRTDGLVKDAVSIGIPYTDNEPLLDFFRFICLRSSTDYNRLHHAHPDKFVYYPDLGFLIPRLLSLPPLPVAFPKHHHHHRPRMGVCLARTFFRLGVEMDYIPFIFHMAETLRTLMEEMDIYLIPFCTLRRKHLEDDNVIHSHILEFLRGDPRVVDTSTWEVNGDPVFHTYSIISHMDFMLCSRFHSHVFSMALRIPFVSFSKNRKVVNLMKENEMEDVMYPYQENQGLPIHLDPHDLARHILYHFHQRHELKHRLSEIMKRLSFHLDQFLAMWVQYINTHRMFPTLPSSTPEMNRSLSSFTTS